LLDAARRDVVLDAEGGWAPKDGARGTVAALLFRRDGEKWMLRRVRCTAPRRRATCNVSRELCNLQHVT
jgi:hypothetical protein